MDTLKNRMLCLAAGLMATACVSGPDQTYTLRQKTLSEVENNLSVDCGTLDRDYTDYDAYKEYLEPLGMRMIRLQAGWAKCEKEKGVYTFAWLDHIIDDAVSRGLQPWLELSYGNPIYEGGGTPFLSGGWPSSPEAVQAWLAWAKELVTRYKGKVHDWEIWNEPDLHIRRNGGDPCEIARLAYTTAQLIKQVDPEATVAAFGIAAPRKTAAVEPMIAEMARLIHEGDDPRIIDWVSYHGYHYIPEESYFQDADSLSLMLERCGWDVAIWQGECGAPSEGHMGGALSKYDWTEVSQAKYALRKMLNDHAHGIRTSIFAMSDMNYASTDAIKTKNRKGLLMTDDNRQVIRPKLAYSACRNLVSIFDNLDEIQDSSRVTICPAPYDAPDTWPDDAYHYGSAETLKPIVHLFSEKESGLETLVYWRGGAAPVAGTDKDLTDISIRHFRCKRPVIIDLVSGEVRRIKGRKRCTVFEGLPYYDAPFVLCDASLIEFSDGPAS